MGGLDKCLLLMTRGGGGVKKTQKPAYVIHGCSLTSTIGTEEEAEGSEGRVSIRGVKSLWVDRRFIPADQGSYWVICAICSF